MEISILYKNGHREEFQESCFEDSNLTVYGHYHEIIKAKREGKADYEYKRVYIVLDEIVSMLLKK